MSLRENPPAPFVGRYSWSARARRRRSLVALKLIIIAFSWRAGHAAPCHALLHNDVVQCLSCDLQIDVYARTHDAYVSSYVYVRAVYVHRTDCGR